MPRKAKKENHSKLVNARHAETNEKFIKRMDAAMEMSLHKYGLVRDAYPHKANAIKTLKKRLKLYEKTGNADYLVDIANFAMIEFSYPAHAKFNDTPTAGGEGRVWHAGGPATERPNK